jgi:hypothetical protein
MYANPFLGYGRSVTCGRLVGREKEIGKVVDYLIAGAGSINVVGEPRVGKSSVVREAVRRAREANPSILIVDLSLSLMNDAASFYRALMDDILEECAALGVPLPLRIPELPCTTEEDAFSRCERGLRMLARRGVTCVVILDEFDFVRKWSGEWGFVIRCVREFVTDPKYGFVGALITQRTISQIEAEATQGGSRISNSMHQIFVGPLSKAGVRAMCQRCLPDWKISARLEQQVLRISGGHPYIAEMLLHAGWETHRIHISEEIDRRLTELYHIMRELHSEDGLFEILVHIAHDSLGPSSPDQRALLTQYGLIVPSREGRVEIFSEHFREFLKNYRPIVSTFDLLRRTEMKIRGFIEKTFQKAYGAAWLQRIAKQNPGISERKDEWERISLRDHARYGHAAPLLSYSFTKDLWEMMSMEWEMFEPVLGGNKKYWDDRFEILVRVRNAVAHHYEEILPAELLETAERYCNELQQSIEREPMPHNVRIMQFRSP